MNKKITKQYVRENLPECTAFADMIRAEFGAGVKMVYAKENGIEIGELSLQDRPSVSLDQIELGSHVAEPEEAKRKGRGK